MAEELTDSDIEYCLLALYRRGSDYKDTARHLKTTYLKERAPTADRLKRWRTGIHRDKYLQVAIANAEDIEKDMLIRMREMATRTGILQMEALDVLVTRIQSGDVTPTMIKELSIITGVSIDKMLVLSGRPDKIVEVQNPDKVIQRLVEAGFADVEGYAVDVTEQRSLTDQRSRTDDP